MTENVFLADANGRFVDRLYRELLNRPVDPAGLAFWTNQLTQGMTRIQVAAGIESSMEFQAVTVQRAYQQYLHRTADPAGLTFWTNFLQQGSTVEQLDAGAGGFGGVPPDPRRRHEQRRPHRAVPGRPGPGCRSCRP